MVPSAAASPVRRPPAATRMVGIGASAGGLAALEQFFEHVAPNSGLAYLVVQHLDPTQKAMLTELLQRVTAMAVREAEGGMPVEPDCVYVIPPNSELTVIDGLLHLERPSEPRGLRLPINVLFSSLAGGQGDRAIAVILSGMGSDGTLGLQAVKAVGGLTLVQAPDTAQFDAMPRSAIDGGYADIVAPPAELPLRIGAYVGQVPDPDSTAEDDEAAPAPTPLESICEILHRRTRHDFSLYKPSTLNRRIERRMAIHDIPTQALYAEFLRHSPQESDLLFKEILIGVTSFFRDPAVWEHLASVTLPDLLARRGMDTHLRAWVVGCSTGEEAYTVAMVFTEAVERLAEARDCTLQIFASDLSADAIAIARRGQYPGSIRAQVTPERLARFFSPQGTYFEINKSIRDMVLFAQHDVVLDPPFTRLDLLSCRNLLIYFDATLQSRLIPLFFYGLRPGGVLLLGSAETVGKFNYLFVAAEPKLRLYLRQDNAGVDGPGSLLELFPPLYARTRRKDAVVPPPTEPRPPTDPLQTEADRLLLQVYAPPAVVLNRSGDIVYISGHTGRYLEPAAGKANWNFHAMVREGLRAPLADALKQAASQREPIQLHGLQMEGQDGAHIVDVTVQALHEPPAMDGMTMVVFRHVAPVRARRGRRKAGSALEEAHAAEIQQYRDEIQTLRERTQVSSEELQSANEELQSTNEELQSTNEELTTSKEEMQSMNEELQTINSELQTKLDDLALAQSDMKNLLNSTEIAILFLDQDLNVRRYTDRATRIINLRSSDIGRPLSDLTTSLQYPDLHEDVTETLGTLVFSEKQVPTDDGRWFNVRIMPYRRLDNVIDGAVITFVDITATKKLEAALRGDAQS